MSIEAGWHLGRSENHKNELGICPECYYYVLVYYKTGFEEKKLKKVILSFGGDQVKFRVAKGGTQ